MLYRRGEIEKQVGFIYAPNWSLNYAIVIPLTLYFCVSALHGVRHVILQLTQKRMLVDSACKPISQQKIAQEWDKVATSAAKWVVVLGCIALAASLIEGFYASPFGHNAEEVQSLRVSKVDWSMKALVYPEEVGKISNGLFTLAAFLAQAAAATACLAFITFLMGFAYLIYSFTLPDKEIRLIPDVDSDDTRRGFEVFGLLIENILLASVFFFCVFYLTRIQRVYMESKAASILTFIRDDVAYGFFNGVLKLFQGGDFSLLHAGDNISYGELMVSAGNVIMLVFVVMIPAIILRQAAMRSRDQFQSLQDFSCDISHVTHLNSEECKKRMEAMDFWPMRYPRPNQLILAAVLAMGCFVFYRLTLVLAGFVLAVALKEAVRIFEKWSGGTPKTNAGT